MLNKAFIFDMDGVIINSEKAWVPHQQKFSTSLFGKKIYQKIGSTIGLSIDTIYQNAVKHGFKMDINKYYEFYDKQAKVIYEAAQPTQNIEILVHYLRKNKLKLGLVSSSRGVWINLALIKLKMKDVFNFILSLNDEKLIRPKPHPDGYIAAMKGLVVSPRQTIILEDSNIGIDSAKSSGAYTIAYKEHLFLGYIQKGADACANNVYDVIQLVNMLI